MPLYGCDDVTTYFMLQTTALLSFCRKNVCACHRYIREIPNLLYFPCNGVISHGAQFQGLQVLPTTHTTAKAKKRGVVLCMFVFTLRLVHEGNIGTWWTMIILITGKTQRPPSWAPRRDQGGPGSGISGVYLWFMYKRCRSLYSWCSAFYHQFCWH